jgi:hypothetical protein
MSNAPLDWLTILVNAAISTPAVAGLLAYLGKRRLDQETAKQNEALATLRTGYEKQLEAYKAQLDTSKRLLQAEIDKTILVTKVHFETEFTALKEVFAKLAELKLQFSALVPSFRVARVDETQEYREKRLTKCLEEFQQAFDELLEAVEHFSAFYPPQIYAGLGECLKHASLEVTEIQLSGDRLFRHDWYQERSESLKKFLVSFNAVSEMIRDRISKLAIVPIQT